MKKTQLYQLILVQFREFYREPGVLFWAIGFPILMAWGLGLAFKQKPEVIRKVAIIENQVSVNGTANDFNKFLQRETKELRVEKDGSHKHVKHYYDKKLGKSTYVFISTDWKNAIILLKRGNVSMIINEDSGRLIYNFDPVNPEARLVQLQIEAMISGNKNFEENADIEPLTLSGTRYIDFLVPGLIVMGIMMSCMWGISWSIIDNRSKKLLRRMIATPMKKSNYLISLFIARLILSLTESIVIYIFAFIYFNLKIQGSIPAALLLCIAGNVAFTGIAILSACRTSKPEIGNGIINAVTTPMLVLSGIFFSYTNFPDWAQPVIQKLPLTILADSVRSIFNEGAGFAESILPICTLSAIGFLTFLLGMKFYKWT